MPVGAAPLAATETSRDAEAGSIKGTTRCGEADKRPHEDKDLI
jgi:hypothetical protein